MIGSESHRPYDRFLLSKTFLTRLIDHAGLAIDSAPADVVWRLGETATRLDLAERQVILGDRTALEFDGLVVGRPAPAPGTSCRDAWSSLGVG